MLYEVITDVVREHGGELRYLMVVGHNPGITEFADNSSVEGTDADF